LIMRWIYLLLFLATVKIDLIAQTEAEFKAALVAFPPKFPGHFLVEDAFPFGHWQLILPDEQLYLFRWDDSSISFEDAKKMILSRIPGVRYVSPNYRATHRNKVPNDPSFDLQWHHKMIRSSAVWPVSTGNVNAQGDTIVIAVLEKGNIDFSHEDMSDVVWINHLEIPENGIDDDENGYIDDYFGLNARTLRDNNVPPDNHATRIGGLIGARGNNGIGVSGVMWNARILSVANVDFMSEILAAFEYIRVIRSLYNQTDGVKGAFVVALNASFGFDRTKPSDDPIFEVWCRLIDRLGTIGVLTIGATSNNRWDVDFVGDMPTNCTSDHMIGVTATNRIDTLDRAAAFGFQSIDLAAPGEGLFSTRTGNMYNSDSGTSYAAPLVTGAVGLLYAVQDMNFAVLSKDNPSKAALEIKAALLNGVRVRSSLQNRTVSGGRLDLFRALDAFTQLGYGQLPDTDKAEVRIWPNPVTEILYYDPRFSGFESHDVVVFDILGRTWLERRGSDQLGFVNVSGLPSGVYFLVLRSGKTTTTIRFIKEK
jgi:subtilisin family serine protease